MLRFDHDPPTDSALLAEVTAAFVVGGRGTRLNLKDLPKPMVDVGGVPLLEHSVRMLAAQGVKKFLFLAGYGADKILAHFGTGERLGVEIDIVTEPEPLGSAGCFDIVRTRMDKPFLVLYGDVLFDIDVARFAAWALERGGDGALYVHPNDHPHDSDLVRLDWDQKVVGFSPKPHSSVDAGNLVNAALYLFSPSIFEHVPTIASLDADKRLLDWGRDILPKAVAGGAILWGYRGSEYLKDIGTPDRLERGRRHLLSGRVAGRSYLRPQRAIFLDRDGVINREINGVHRPDMLELMPGAAEAIAKLNASGYLTIVATNQPSVAKGFMTPAELDAVHARMDFLLAESGAYVDDLYFCPHHPDRGWAGEVATLKIDCTCRKPKPGMLLWAAKAHNIDLQHSFMLGDNRRDIEAAIAAGCRPVFITGGAARPAELPPGVETADSLAEWVTHFLR